MLLPYAITREAVDYYSGLLDFLEADSADQFLITADFAYEARVSFETSFTVEGTESYPSEKPSIFKQVYVVSMILVWEQYCGVMCGMGVRAERVVVFDKSGTLIDVFFDRQHPVAVV